VMFILYEYFRNPGTMIPYKEVAESVCRKMGWDPELTIPTLPFNWHQAGYQQLVTGPSMYSGSGQSDASIRLEPTLPHVPKVPLWVVVATYIEINRAVLFSLREAGCPSTLLENSDALPNQT
jgi:hypothetical protein